MTDLGPRGIYSTQFADPGKGKQISPENKIPPVRVNRRKTRGKKVKRRKIRGKEEKGKTGGNKRKKGGKARGQEIKSGERYS